jgi:hypothetical protein
LIVSFFKKDITTGIADMYKAELVTKGYTQVEGIQYKETFSAILKMALIRLLLAFAIVCDLELE